MLRIEKESLPDLFSRLVQDAREAGRAELQLAKAKILPRVQAAKIAMILFGAALLIALASITGLVLGLVLALLPYVGALLAGVIVLVGGLVIAGILGWIGARQLSAPSAAKVVK